LHLIVGLGNPGHEYRDTRHNVGFMVIDEVARRHGLKLVTAPAQVADALMAKRYGERPLLVAKPLTYMNRSGTAVGGLARYFDISLDAILVVVDEVALPFGRLRVRTRGTAGGHNGLKSVIDGLGTTEFARLRLGVGRGDGKRDLSSHVLGGFEVGEQPALKGFITRGADAAEMFVAEGIKAMMNVYNPEPASPELD
jgi:PTH1 family peptidyl-tRNA hydrolase